jgi:2-haloacid dehalogenase
MEAVLQIKALLFDVFGTVVDWRSSIAREVERALGADHPEISGYEFADAWRAKYQPAMERVRQGEREWVKLDELHRDNLLEVLTDYKVAGMDAGQIDDLNFAWHRLSPWPDSVTGLTRLKSKFIIGTLSNGNIALIVKMAKNAGLPWDVVLGAEVARAYKPTPESYLRSAAALSLKPEQCMLVAAHNSDLLAALKTGFKTAFVVRPTEYGPNQDFDIEAEHDYDYIAADFLDLADQLECVK